MRYDEWVKNGGAITLRNPSPTINTLHVPVTIHTIPALFPTLLTDKERTSAFTFPKATIAICTLCVLLLGIVAAIFISRKWEIGSLIRIIISDYSWKLGRKNAAHFYDSLHFRTFAF